MLAALVALLMFEPAQSASRSERTIGLDLNTPRQFAISALDGHRPKSVAAHTTTTVHGLHPVTWTYVSKRTPRQWRELLVPEFGRTFEHSPLDTETATVNVSVSLTKGLIVKGKRVAEEEWTTISVTEAPVFLSPPKFWPDRARVADEFVPRPPLRLLAGLRPLASYRWGAAGGKGIDYRYVVDGHPETTWRLLESEFSAGWQQEQYNRFATAAYPAHFLRDVGDRRNVWEVAIRHITGRPNSTLVIVTRRVEGVVGLSQEWRRGA